MSILVSGSLAYDHIMDFPDSFKNHILPNQIHILNVCFMVEKLEKNWGGTAGNIAYTIKLLGGDPLLVSALGKDGEEYIKHFKSLGINTDLVVHDKKQLTASAYITTDVDDNQIIAFYNGPLGLAQGSHISDVVASPLLKGDGQGVMSARLALISPTSKEVMVQHLKECFELGIETVFDPGQQITAFKPEELKRMINQSAFVIGNDYEMKLLEEKTGWSGAEMLKQTKTLITTLGAKGSIISTNDGQTIEVASCPPQSVDDPTGAGDSFRAGFFTAYEKGLDLKTCAQVGSVAASYAIETYGTQAHKFTLAEFGARYEKCYKEKLML